MSRRRTAAAWIGGAMIAGAYLIVAEATFRSGLVPVRPLYEGFAPPQPYRWVNPPPEFAADNRPPEAGETTVKLTKTGTEPGNASTLDGQMVVALYAGSIKPKSGETAVRIRLTPLDPATFGRAPDGLTYDSNAYRVEATYARSGTPAAFSSATCPARQQPKTCPTIIMRYARGARALYRRDGTSWARLDATPAQSSLQIFADTPGGGVFVAAAHLQGSPKKGTPVTAYVALALGAAALIAAGFAGGTNRGRTWLRTARKKTTRAVLGPPKPRRPGSRGRR